MRNTDFITQLRTVWKALGRRDTCLMLGIEPWQLSNWLYRDKPSKMAIRVVGPLLQNKYDEIRNRKTR